MRDFNSSKIGNFVGAGTLPNYVCNTVYIYANGGVPVNVTFQGDTLTVNTGMSVILIVNKNLNEITVSANCGYSALA